MISTHLLEKTDGLWQGFYYDPWFMEGRLLLFTRYSGFILSVLMRTTQKRFELAHQIVCVHVLCTVAFLLLACRGDIIFDDRRTQIIG